MHLYMVVHPCQCKFWWESHVINKAYIYIFYWQLMLTYVLIVIFLFVDV